MMKTKKYYVSALFRFLLLCLFVGYYSSITLFYHIHLVNGQIITHSHPFKSAPKQKSPFQTHSHSTLAYAFIQQLNDSSWDNTPSIAHIPEPSVVFFAYSTGYLAPDFGWHKHSQAQLRAPPLL